MLDGVRAGKSTNIVELEVDSLSLIAALLHKYIKQADDCSDKTQAIVTLEHMGQQTHVSGHRHIQMANELVITPSTNSTWEDLYLIGEY